MSGPVYEDQLILPALAAAAALVLSGPAAHAQFGGDALSDVSATEPALEGLAPLSEVLLLQTPAVSVALSQALSVADESPRFAEPFAVDVTPATYGRWETTSSGRTAVWRLRVASAGAVSLNFGFTRYRMPPGGRLRIHAPDGAEDLGPYTDADNELHGELWTPVISGGEAVIEVALPVSRVAELELELGSVNRGFRELGVVVSPDHSSCMVDVVCSQGDNYRDQIRSVGFITVSGVANCTGTLINTAAGNSKPYFLTARHCGFDYDAAARARTVVVYWNYKSPTCGNRSGGSKSQSQTGAYLRAESSSSDVALLELDDPLDPAHNLYLPGWEREAVPTSAAAIHFPLGEVMAISLEDDELTLTSYKKDDSPGDSSYLRVAGWDTGSVTNNSSGGALFDQNQRIVGQLRGGLARCGGWQRPVWYGWMGRSWTGGGSAATRLSDWLDPNGDGDTAIDGMNPQYAPAAEGTLDDRILQVGETALTIDMSDAFSDGNNDELTYASSSSDDSVATAEVSGSQVTLTPVARGTATVTVTATDVAGSNTPATQLFDLRVKGRAGVTVSSIALTINEGSTRSYTVALDSEPTGPVSVTPSVESDADVSVSPLSLTFTTEDWGMTKTVTVEAEHDEDALADAPATISHQVAGSDYGSVSAASLRVTIVEDDFPTLSIESPEPMPESGGTLRFRTTLSTASSKEVTVDYMTSDGSGVAGARAGSDYVASTGTLTFSAGSTTPQLILADVIDDGVDEEEAETLELTLRNARNASLAGGGATLRTTATIRDDDDPEVEISFGSPRYEAVEGATVHVAVYLNRDPERSLVIDLIRTPPRRGNGRRLLGRAPERHVP